MCWCTYCVEFNQTTAKDHKSKVVAKPLLLLIPSLNSDKVWNLLTSLPSLNFHFKWQSFHLGQFALQILTAWLLGAGSFCRFISSFFIVWTSGTCRQKRVNLYHHMENWEEPTMADSPRTDISADADTDDKNQRVFLLSPPLSLSLSRVLFYFVIWVIPSIANNWFCASSILVVWTKAFSFLGRC